jgi:hypothetical protein
MSPILIHDMMQHLPASYFIMRLPADHYEALSVHPDDFHVLGVPEDMLAGLTCSRSLLVFIRDMTHVVRLEM